MRGVNALTFLLRRYWVNLPQKRRIAFLIISETVLIETKENLKIKSQLQYFFFHNPHARSITTQSQ